MSFKDDFSQQANSYQQFRPRYPQALYDWLSTIVPATSNVWDCATGNGQAAVALADRFDSVYEALLAAGMPTLEEIFPL